MQFFHLIMQVIQRNPEQPSCCKVNSSCQYYCFCCMGSWAINAHEQNPFSPCKHFVSLFFLALVCFTSQNALEWLILSLKNFMQKNDNSWNKSSSHYVLTSYLQPLLLWSGATLICRFQYHDLFTLISGIIQSSFLLDPYYLPSYKY